MKKFYKFLIFAPLAALLFISTFAYLQINKNSRPDSYDNINRLPRIRPDYSDVIIPPNIAPLNFMIQEKGSRFFVKIYSKQGQTIEISSKSPKIEIPEKSWRKLLLANLNEELFFDIFVKNEKGQWNLFDTIKNRIAPDDIDGFLVYRKMHPTSLHMGGRMAICQRNLENFSESLILDNSFYKDDCLNCHSFPNNNPNQMILGVRGTESFNPYKPYAKTLLVEDDTVAQIETKFGYTSWHPSGRLAAFAVNNIPMAFHSGREEIRDTIDINALIAYYLTDSKTLKVVPQLSNKTHLETWPAWSPDGRYLYYCSAHILWSNLDQAVSQYKEIKYDLMRISYNIDLDQWGDPETILTAQQTGRSIAMPRVSPDGRRLLFCMCDYGYFPTWQQSSDLYLMDLESADETGQYKYRLLENPSSDQSESWQCWSSNSRWFVFSSKRDYGEFTRPYFSYVDENGKVYKPVLMPQKDPAFYDSCLETYSLPELIMEPVKVKGNKLAKAVHSPDKITVKMPITMATPKADDLRNLHKLGKQEN